jgi:hypothetical protein
VPGLREEVPARGLPHSAVHPEATQHGPHGGLSGNRTAGDLGHLVASPTGSRLTEIDDSQVVWLIAGSLARAQGSLVPSGDAPAMLTRGHDSLHEPGSLELLSGGRVEVGQSQVEIAK